MHSDARLHSDEGRGWGSYGGPQGGSDDDDPVRRGQRQGAGGDRDLGGYGGQGPQGAGGQGSQGRYSGAMDEQQQQFDPDYHQWRNEQMRSLDDDYRSWRQDRYKKFSDEFSTWRSSRQGNGDGSSGDSGSAMSS